MNRNMLPIGFTVWRTRRGNQTLGCLMFKYIVYKPSFKYFLFKVLSIINLA